MASLTNDDNHDVDPEATVTFETNDVDTVNYEELLSTKSDDDDDDAMIDVNITNDNQDQEQHSTAELHAVSCLRIHEDAVCGLTTSPHQALLASVGDDYRLVLYKINDEQRLQCIRRIKKKYLPVDVAFDNSGDCLAIAMVDGVIEIWDVASMKPIYTLQGHTGSVLQCQWSPSHRNTLASISNDQTIRIWHPHSMASTRAAHVIQLETDTLDFAWQQTSRRHPLLSSVDRKNTLRIYSNQSNSSSDEAGAGASAAFKQIYVGRSMGDRIAFGAQCLIAVNGYHLNLFDAHTLDRLSCIKSHKYHHALVNNIALQYIPCSNTNEHQHEHDHDCGWSNAKSLFATSDKSEENVLCVWQFNDDCSNAHCIAKTVHAHHRNDRKLFSLIPKPVQLPSSASATDSDNNGKLPIPTAFDEEQKYNGNAVNGTSLNESETETDEEDEAQYTDFITCLEFCKHAPNYLVSAAKDGTLKLWDCSQLAKQQGN